MRDYDTVMQEAHEARLWCFAQDGGSPLREPALRWLDLRSDLEETEQDGRKSEALRLALDRALTDCVVMARRHRSFRNP